MRFMKTLWLGFACSFLFAFMLSSGDQAHAQRGKYSGWGMGPGIMSDWGLGWLGMILMIVFWILVIGSLVFLIHWWKRQTNEKNISRDSSKERYARGEINEEEFKKM